MSVKYAFDSVSKNVNYEIGTPLSAKAVQSTETKKARLTYVVDSAECIPDVALRKTSGRGFGAMALVLNTHLTSAKIDDTLYYAVSEDGLSHEDDVKEHGNGKRLYNSDTKIYHLSSAEMKHAINAGAYDDFDRFNAELNQSLVGIEYGIDGEVSMVTSELENGDEYRQIIKSEDVDFFNEDSPSTFDLLLLSGMTKVQADFSRRSTIRQRSDEERAKALANSKIEANDISYEREDTGNELDLGLDKDIEDDLNSKNKDEQSANKEDEKDSKVDSSISSEKHSIKEGKPLSYNPDADDELEY